MWEKKKAPYGESVEVYDYVRRISDRLPEYWQDKGIRVCIDGMKCMMARDKYTDMEIAEFYECPVVLVKQVRKAYRRAISKLRKEWRENKEEYDRIVGDVGCGGNDDLGYVELLGQILQRCKR